MRLLQIKVNWTGTHNQNQLKGFVSKTLTDMLVRSFDNCYGPELITKLKTFHT